MKIATMGAIFVKLYNAQIDRDLAKTTLEKGKKIYDAIHETNCLPIVCWGSLGLLYIIIGVNCYLFFNPSAIIGRINYYLMVMFFIFLIGFVVVLLIGGLLSFSDQE